AVAPGPRQLPPDHELGSLNANEALIAATPLSLTGAGIRSTVEGKREYSHREGTAHGTSPHTVPGRSGHSACASGVGSGRPSHALVDERRRIPGGQRVRQRIREAR